LLAYQAFLDRTATMALMTGRCQRENKFPTFEKLTGRQPARSGQAMSSTMMAHNIRLWRHALGQDGDAQQQGG
jgi:hypothetical protein